MLRNLTRFLVALAIALAVPAQGYAAVAAGLCMALGHHQDTQAGANERGTHDHAAASASDHSAAAAHDDGDKSEKSHDKAHCPPCVSCCAAATIAPAAGIGVPEIPPVAAVPSAPYSLAGILPEKLDRPPLAL